MKRKTIISCLLLALFFLVGVVRPQDQPAKKKSKKPNKQICITFDDLPVVRVHDRIQRLMITDRILGTLEEFNVTAAGFVIGNNIEGDPDLIESWLAKGHIIGYHTNSHPDLNTVPPALYIQDIIGGVETIEDMLVKAGQKRMYFRYPYLHYGNSLKSKEEVADYLYEMQYQVAHVSVDTDDYAFNLQYEKIYRSDDSVRFIQIGNEYLDHIVVRLEEAEKLADEILGHPVKQILLLHANRLNSDFLAELLTEIQTLGYSFIDLDQALSDPVYSLTETYIGPMGISYLERLAESNPDLLPARDR